MLPEIHFIGDRRIITSSITEVRTLTDNLLIVGIDFHVL
jgi:hypothetical protein